MKRTSSVWPGTRRPGARGLTLVELVMALGFVSALLALVFFMYTSFTGALASSETQFTGQQEARRVLDEVSREVRYALLLEVSANHIGASTPLIYHSGTSVFHGDALGGQRLLSDRITLMRFSQGATDRILKIEIEATMRDRTVGMETEVLLLNTRFTGVNGGAAAHFTKP